MSPCCREARNLRIVAARRAEDGAWVVTRRCLGCRETREDRATLTTLQPSPTGER
jgi:hypothetical protein